MKNVTLPVIRKFFAEKIGKTAIECTYGDTVLTVFVPGDKSNDPSLLCNITINEVGDTFTATKDSSTMAADGKTPVYKKGDTVVRQKQSVEYKSFAGDNQAAQFAQAANAFGLQLIVQM